MQENEVKNLMWGGVDQHKKFYQERIICMISEVDKVCVLEYLNTFIKLVTEE